MVGDLGLAEDLAQDALVAAMTQWPTSGIPARPGAWLTTVARRRWVDGVRRDVVRARAVAEVGRVLDPTVAAVDVPDEVTVADDVLRLIFTACHPVLPLDGQVALSLKVLAGLSTEEIASAFLVAPATMAQRIVRAKRTLRAAGVPFEVPAGDGLAARLEAVLRVVYLIFNEGYAATSGTDRTRPELCEEAMRLGRMLTALAPREPEAHALSALMELQASRLPARTDPGGAVITLADQDRGRWDRLLVTRGLAALGRVQALGGSAGRYALQAAIAGCHARARAFPDTDWSMIAALYGQLSAAMPSPVVDLNRAVAVSMADGPAAALPLVDKLSGSLADYHLLHAVRGDLLARLDRGAEAGAAFRRAAELTANEAERAHLLARAGAGPS